MQSKVASNWQRNKQRKWKLQKTPQGGRRRYDTWRIWTTDKVYFFLPAPQTKVLATGEKIPNRPRSRLKPSWRFM